LAIAGSLGASLPLPQRPAVSRIAFIAGLPAESSTAAETVNSRKAYQDFLALWKDADPDVPIPKEVKAEYAKLQ
jgi:hypothetical protein